MVPDHVCFGLAAVIDDCDTNGGFVSNPVITGIETMILFKLPHRTHLQPRTQQLFGTGVADIPFVLDPLHITDPATAGIRLSPEFPIQQNVLTSNVKSNVCTQMRSKGPIVRVGVGS